MNNQLEKTENKLKEIENQLVIMRDMLIKLEKAQKELEIAKGLLITFGENNKKKEINNFYDGIIKNYRAISGNIECLNHKTIQTIQNPNKNKKK